jgi:hypothetical protein
LTAISRKPWKAARNPNEKTRIQRQIDSTDEQIDKLVYELYGLTAEEVDPASLRCAVASSAKEI